MIFPQLCSDCSDKDILIDELRNIISSLRKDLQYTLKDLKDSERLVKLIKGQKQLLIDKNAALRSGDVPNTVRKRIVEDTLKGNYSNMASVLFLSAISLHRTSKNLNSCP